MSDKKRFRSAEWFQNSHRPDMAAIYIERYTNNGYTFDELVSGKPIIGIAQTGSDLRNGSDAERERSDWPKR